MEDENQNFFSIESSLPRDIYSWMEKQIQKENSKTFKIIYKNEPLTKLHSLLIEEEEFMEVYTLFENNQVVLPDHLNPTLINTLIHYFYFREIKQLSMKSIFDFLHLIIFLNVNELIKKIIDFLKNSLTNSIAVIFIRKNIFPFIFLQTPNEQHSIEQIFEKCEISLLQNNDIDNYLSFYAHDYFLNENIEKLDIEQELEKKLQVMNDYEIHGLDIIKLILLFQENLIKIKKNDNNFIFKTYAQRLIAKFVNFQELDLQSLAELLFKLELNIKDFKIKILNEKIAYLENEIVTLKQSSIEQKKDHDAKFDELKQEYNRKFDIQKEEFKKEIESFKLKFGEEMQRDKLLIAHIIKEYDRKFPFKTIESDFEKHYKFIASLFNLNSFDELAQKLHLLYRASEHNFDSFKFHQLCDGKGPTLVIIRSKSKRTFGGYSTVSWHSTNLHSSAPGSFLFSLEKQTKHTIYQNEDKAIKGFNNYGPIFGAGSDIFISNFCNKNNTSNSNLGYTYSLPNGMSYGTSEAQSHFDISKYFEVEEYEVFSVE